MVEGLYEHVFEKTAAAIAVHEPSSGRFESVNRAYAEALGYEAAELEGQSLTALADRAEAPLTGAIERALEGTTEQVETSLADASGDTRQVTLDLTSIRVDDQQRLVSTLQSVTDETEDRRPTVTEQRLELALTGTDTGVWEWDMETDEVIWTESMERLFGLEPGSFEGTFEAFAKRVHPDDLPEVQEAIETAVERDELFQTEYRIEREDGQERWVSARGELHGAADGPGRIIGIVTDITDRKENERALRRQERQYRQLVERLPEAHYTIDRDFRFTFCNEALAERLGEPVEEIEGELLWNLLPEAKGSIVEQTFERVMETGEHESFEYQFESGEHWVSVQAYPYDGGVAAVSTDISDQREELLTVLDVAPVALYRFDTEGVLYDVRGQILSRLGFEPEDLIGESIFEVYGGHDQVLESIERALDGESFRQTFEIGGLVLETHYTPVYENGEVAEVIGVSVDITEFQRQRERMEFFNSILRHDVLNGMTVIKMRAELLATELDGDHQQYAQTIVDWCNTTTEVTKRVRRVVQTLATPEEEHQLEPIDISGILRRKVREMETAYPEVTFETTVPKSVQVRADELLADVLGNVLTNSIEHNDTDGLRVETSVEVGEDTVEIRIADNGTGIDDDRKEAVFRRGETSHAKETGSGFGLFFVDVMVEKYGGDIRIEDSESGGACFVIELVSDGVFR